MKCVLAIAVMCCLGAPSARAVPVIEAEKTRNQQLALLDSGAGLVVSLELPQLATAHSLAVELAPQERQALNLAGLGAGAILGFNPFNAKAWRASGFDTSTPMVAQIAAADTGDTLLKTRLIFGVKPGQGAQRTIERMRLGDKARPHVKRDALAPLFSAIPKTPGDEVLRKELTRAGVFLVARPRPLSGLLFAQRRGAFIILDIFEPAGSDFQTVLGLLERRPATLDVSMRGADALLTGPVGLWLRAAEFGTTLERAVLGDAKRRKSCRAVAGLGRSSSITSVGIHLGLARKALKLNATWHLQSSNRLLANLRTLKSPLLTGHDVLDAQIHVARWDLLRDLPRPPQAQSWDKLWAHTKACEQGSQLYAIATAWPEIVGLFLKEVSVIHPFAKTAINSLGATSAQVSAGAEGVPTVIAEGWVRGPGVDISKAWLKTLFGSEEVRAGQTLWGKGPIRPYSIDERSGGIAIGAGFQMGSRRFALAAKRAKAAAAPSEGVLASARARPDKLAALAPSIPAVSWLAPWKNALVSLEAGNDKLEVSISLDR